MKFCLAAFRFVLLLLLAGPVGAQDIVYYRYTDQNGLPSQEVYQILEDRSGHLWFSTDNGVVRYDGQRFELFNKTRGLIDPVVFSLTEDARGRLWFKSFSGKVGYIQDGQVYPYAYSDKVQSLLGKTVYYNIHVDSVDNFYLSILRKGMYVISPSGHIRELPGVSDYGFGLWTLPDSAEMIAYKERGKHLDKIVFHQKVLSVPDPPNSNGPVLMCRWRGRVFFSNYDRLYEVNEAGVRRLPFSNGVIISMRVDSSDRLWIGSSNRGVIGFDTDDFTAGFSPGFLQGMSVTSVWKDREGGYWFSTLDRGVFRVPNLELLRYAMPTASKVSHAFGHDRLLFTAHVDGQLFCWDGAGRKVRWARNFGEPIVSGFADKEMKTVWISLSSRALILDESGQVLREFSYKAGGINFNGIRRFMQLPDRVLAVNLRGVLRFDRKGNFISEIETNFWCRNFLLQDGHYLLAGPTGLYRSDTLLKSIAPIAAMSNSKISALHNVPGGALVGTVGSGLFRIAPDGTIHELLPGSELTRDVFTVDGRDTIWIGTSEGLMRSTHWTATETGIYDFIGKDAGLPSGQVTHLLQRGHEIWIFSGDALYVGDKRRIVFNNDNPQPRVIASRVNEIQVNAAHLENLRYSQNNIGLELGFQSFNNHKVFVRYRLRSTDPWVETTEHLIRFFSLAPGGYPLQVQYSLDRSRWREVDAVPLINITPPWWQSWIFRIVVLLTVPGLLYWFVLAQYRRRILYLSMQNKLKAEKERIARDLHDNIGARLAVLSIDLGMLDRPGQQTGELLGSMRENVSTTITELRDTIWAMHKQGVTMKEFCDKVNSLLIRIPADAPDFFCFLKESIPASDPILSPVQAINLYRIIQEALINCRKYAGAKRFEVEVIADELGHIQINVTDDGKGFDPATIGRERYGIANMQARAEEIHANFLLESTPGAGTRIQVIFNLT